MAVKLEKQNSLLGSPLTWVVLLAGVGGGVWFYMNRPKEEPPVVVAPPPPPPVKKEPDFVNLAPPKEEPKPPVVVTEPEPKKTPDPEPPKTPEKPKDPEVAYAPLKDARIVKPKYGKGGDALDREMWGIDASPKKPYKCDASLRALAPKIAEYLEKDARKTGVHPSAKDFPGAVPDDAPRMIKAVKVPLKTSRWFFTGMYAPPGEIIRIQTSSELKGATVVIGCHRDNIAGAKKREQTHRFPLISNTHRIDKNSMEVANPFGGLIYIDVPAKKEWENSRTLARVEIAGAVEAPIFILGETTPEEWKRIRKAPAPWGEIDGGSHCAAARSERFREMDFDTAKALAEYWDKAVDLEDWLCGWGPRRSPERMVPDAEITVGSGHSGYPYMGYLDWEGWTNLKKITEDGSWGHYHEIGHNHQSGAWTFEGFGEVTNNVMALLCQEKLAGIGLDSGRGWLSNLNGSLASRLGPPAKEDAAGNLAMYVPVIKAFGWDSLRSTWAEYIKKGTRTGMNLSTDAKKKEQFVLLWSKHCKTNLGPYFETFGFPYTPVMRSRLGSMKRWMPANFPPKAEADYVAPVAADDHGAPPAEEVMEN